MTLPSGKSHWGIIQKALDWHCAGLFPIRQSNSFKYCLNVVVAIDAGGKTKWLRYKKHRNAFSTPQKWIRVPQINSAPVGFSVVGRWCLTSLEGDNTCGKHEQLCSSETLVSVWECLILPCRELQKVWHCTPGTGWQQYLHSPQILCYY